jgi:uncharacterized membrane protein
VSHNRFRTVIVIASFGLAAIVFLMMPGGLRPTPDTPAVSWVVRAAAAFFLPFAAAGLLFVFGRVAAKDPFRENYARFLGTYELLVDLAVALIVAFQVLLGAWMLFGRMSSAPALWFVPTTLVGLTLMIAGNVLPRLRPNSALGIRTPWTLRDERTWTQTHRAGGYLLVVLGLAFFVVTFIDFQKVWWVAGPGLVLTLIGLPLLSYVFWRSARRLPADPRLHTKED